MRTSLQGVSIYNMTESLHRNKPSLHSHPLHPNRPAPASILSVPLICLICLGLGTFALPQKVVPWSSRGNLFSLLRSQLKSHLRTAIPSAFSRATSDLTHLLFMCVLISLFSVLVVVSIINMAGSRIALRNKCEQL